MRTPIGQARALLSDPAMSAYASMSSAEREISRHGQMMSALRAIRDQVQEQTWAETYKDQRGLPFRIEEKTVTDVSLAAASIQPQTGGLEEIHSVVVTCPSIVPEHLTLYLDSSHTLYLTNATVAAGVTIFTLTQLELLVHSETRQLTWSAGTEGNLLSVVITGKAIPQLRGKTTIQ